MNKTISLKKVAKYSDARIPIKNVTIDNFVTTDNLLQNKLGITKATSLPPQDGNMPAYFKNDILVGNIRPYLKKIWFADKDGGNSADVLTIKINEKHNPKFIYYALYRDDFFEHMMKGSKGTKMPRGDKNQIMDFSIPDISLESEEKIANVLSSLDSKIELNNKINKELETMAKTLYDYWFVQFDFPDENGKPYKSSGGKMVYNQELKREIPEGWEVDELKNLISIERGISYKSSDITDMGIPMVNLNSFYLDGTYKPEGIKYFNSAYNNNKIVKAGDLIIATTDVTRNADIIGKATLIPDIYNSDIILSCDIAKINCKDSLNKYFLEKLFNSDFYHNYIKGFASGTLVLHLNTNGIDWYKTFIPPNNLLNKFSNILAPIQRKKELITLENQELAKLRDWLLPMLMNGQVSVK
ncbi:restriction endonuclease subunit S [Aliarcobacter butzleri]|uniref:restriction endonuclease subunit S n=1 Tax=Aliarcobacter butzleri TaxID=28197 RepID=UPI00263CFA59|nr:restriction endonuclease subunit S [Aliarcobacter butzleri]MDN5100377.1 restriction endonuclease subunit S [Aliarcobacter butzleri]